MKSVIISIGDEVLIGQVVNTNAAWLGKELVAMGFPAGRIVTIPDNEKEILKEFRSAYKNYDIIAVTGGLGPTHDDITVKTVAKFFKSKYVLNEKVLKHVKNIFARRKIQMPAANIGQALVPDIAKVLENKTGTAPGLLIDKAGKVFCVMPGVPYEMKYISRTGFFPYLQKKFSSKKRNVIKQQTLHTIGIGESMLAEKLGDINKIVRKGNGYEVKLAFLPSNYEVRLRVTVSAVSEFIADKLLKETTGLIKTKAGNFIYSDSESSIEKTVGSLLKKKKLTISCAESCTGGLLTSKLTDISGSSGYVMDAIVGYANEAKQRLLGVKKETLKKYGAVSELTAIEMAEGIRKRSKTDIGLSTTGIAGPTGARPGKPVGLVWIGYSDKKISFAKKYIFTKDRLRNKDIMAKMALEVVRRQLTIDNYQ
ncbi:MAG: competence/damage-inducible protein CinA [Chlorobi bacterium OLB5]|nr:MAG: competence/damage-inducible protein CinA [Chlorobi bacterium OLB5]